ncbi:hypothetical protein [Pseudomonas sp. NA-150]
MTTTQIVLLFIFGAAVIAWGAHRDLKNYKKEKAENPLSKDPSA